VGAGGRGVGFGVAGAGGLMAGFGVATTATVDVDVGVGVGATTPASACGKSRTTASRVGSGVGWLMATRLAFAERGPPPHAAHAAVAMANAQTTMRRFMVPPINRRADPTRQTSQTHFVLKTLVKDAGAGQ